MLGKLKSMITSLYREIVNHFPVKGCVLNITGNGALNPITNSSYNVQSVVRTGVGVFSVTLSRATFFGIDITSNSAISCSWNIPPTVTTEAFKVDIAVSAGAMAISVYALTVSGAKVIRTPVDISVSDDISISLIMSGGAELPQP